MDYGVKAFNFSILINGAPIEYFHLTVGLRQNYLLSHYPFIFYVDALSRALNAIVQELELKFMNQSWRPTGLPLEPDRSRIFYL